MTNAILPRAFFMSTDLVDLRCQQSSGHGFDLVSQVLADQDRALAQDRRAADQNVSRRIAFDDNVRC